MSEQRYFVIRVQPVDDVFVEHWTADQIREYLRDGHTKVLSELKENMPGYWMGDDSDGAMLILKGEIVMLPEVVERMRGSE